MPFITKMHKTVAIVTCSAGIGYFLGKKSQFASESFIKNTTTVLVPLSPVPSLESGHSQSVAVGRCVQDPDSEWLSSIKRKILLFTRNNSNIYAKSVPSSQNDALVVRDEGALQPSYDKAKSNNVSSPVGQIVKHGFPSTDNLRSYEDFIISYDRRTRTANWVLEHLTPEKVTRVEGIERSKMKFVEDQSVHMFHRATNKDYQGSGYDRGHLAAAANHRHSVTAMSQTFLLSNVAPQVGAGFNRDAWNNLEKYVRALARRSKNVYVCTGPLYLPRLNVYLQTIKVFMVSKICLVDSKNPITNNDLQKKSLNLWKEPDGKLYVKYEVIGENHVAVPTHFFKVVVVENQDNQIELQSYVMPNQPLPDVKLHHYLMPLEMIERAAGLNFFQNIPKSAFKKINAVSGS